jgi:hypothetical protein
MALPRHCQGAAKALQRLCQGAAKALLKRCQGVYLIWFIIFKARSAVRDLDPSNELTILRLRTMKNEILLTPGK